MILHGYRHLSEPDPGVTLIVPPHPHRHWDIPRWWYKAEPGRAVVYEGCAKLDLGNGTNLFISGDEDMSLNLSYQGHVLTLHDDEHNRSVVRVLATNNLDGVIRGTEPNYTDYQWYRAKDVWVEHKFGTGAPL
jgi:hypothetical protein